MRIPSRRWQQRFAICTTKTSRSFGTFSITYGVIIAVALALAVIVGWELYMMSLRRLTCHHGPKSG